MWNDIIYVSLLLSCITFGVVYRKIENLWKKQWISTGFGFIVLVIASGRHSLHPLMSLLLNAIIITKLSSKICHLVSFFFSFFYLLVIFRLGHLFGLTTPPSHTNLIQMILTLKMSGLAFEVNAAAHAPADDTRGTRSKALEKVKFLDVIHYGLSYMGILTGPYYRYRTYWDSLHRPFVRYVDPWPLTYYKLKQATIFSVLFLIMNYAFPSQYVVSEEYEKLPFFFKWLVMYPVFATFRLRIFSGMIFSECACQMAGLGAYPVKSDALAGMGPRNYKIIEELCAKTEEQLKQENYDFETVHNINVWQVETCLTIRSCMKNWNSSVQYWMASCVYKRFPYRSLRTMATLSLSALWHGYAAGYYICICCIPLYLLFEDELVKLYEQYNNKNNIKQKAAAVAMWVTRLSFMAYLGISFLLLDFYQVLQWYASLYFIGHISVAVLYIVIRCVKSRVPSKKKERNME